MKRPKKQPPTAKPCIFCPRPRGSKEHFWPRWMHSILPPPAAEPRFNKLTRIFSPFMGTHVGGRPNTQGALHTIQLRVVCTTCNSGWMSEIEKAAQPFLTPLIKGDAVTLNRAALDTVAKWIALKVMIAEHGEPNCAVTPRPLRMAFRDTGAIPNYMRIYVASHDLPFEKSVGYRRNSQAMVLGPADPNHVGGGSGQMINSLVRGAPAPSPPLGDVDNNIETLTFFLGRVFVHATATRVDNFKIEDIALIPTLYDTAQIWPPRDAEMTWPREPAFTLKQVDSIGESMMVALDAQRSIWTNKVPETGAGTA